MQLEGKDTFCDFTVVLPASMKILETQNAVLTNIEFYRFVKEREAILSSRSRNKATRRRGPPNSEANSDKLIREVRLPAPSISPPV